MATKKSGAFDFNNYVIGRETESKTLTIPDTGESFEVSIKPLSWAKRNQFYWFIEKKARFLYLTPIIVSKFIEMNEKSRWRTL